MGISKFIFTRLMGWSIEGTFDAKIKKAVVIVIPHTSWHDFYIGVFVRRILGIEINFVGKKELFKPPFGWYFKWMGGAELDRTPGQNKVDAIAEIYNRKEEFRLAIAPEGTRKKVTQWKTGFYYIALKANVPIYPVAFDYGSKTVFINPVFYPTGSIEADLKILEGYYKNIVGKVAENSWD
ncbi:MAG: acyltransferase [Flavobacteriaceae bacterium]|nr:acyltransferase [Flavobacteriaceae bacterium]